jgi:hypothetical protein
MRTKIALLILFEWILIAACERTDPTFVINAGYSGCNPPLKSTTDSKTDHTETLHLKFIRNGQMLVGHSNVYFNCSPGEITIDCKITEENQIHVFEDETDHAADCICPYNLKYTIIGIKKGENSIIMYTGNIERYRCSFIFTNQTDTVIYNDPYQ